MYAKIQDGKVIQYPYTLEQLYEDTPGVAFPPHLTAETLAPFDVVIVVATAMPQYDQITQSVIEDGPVFVSKRNRWEQQWSVIDASLVEIAQRKTALQAKIVAATQARLDAFASTRGYDGVLSACTYATSAVPKFRAEGQYCVGARDATWAKLYQMLAEVESGTRPMPTGFADVEAELPALVWPA